MRRLEHALELLDAPRHDPAELEQSLDQVAEVNQLLGGRRAVLRALAPLLGGSATTSILDLGTGSADIPLAVARSARRHGVAVEILATDLHPQMRAIARTRTQAVPEIRIGAADALALPFANDAFDVVLLSLTLHHFEADDQVTALREAARVARRAVIVNELERCRINYVGARLLAATRWRANRLTRHDGPLSVLRAFTRAELADLARSAGLDRVRVSRHFFYRLVLVADTSGPAHP
jgi:ubiquinone/menaquinone biosynthesis C-methylase UbiE